MFYTLAAAAKATGLSEQTILKAVEDGGITGTRDLFGDWQIERNALHHSCAPIELPGAASEMAQSRTPSDAANLEADIEALIKEAGNTLRQQPDQARRDPDRGRGIVSLVPSVPGRQPQAAATTPGQPFLRPRRSAGPRWRSANRAWTAIPERDAGWGDHVRARTKCDLLVPSATPRAKRIRAALVAAALLAALGLGWIGGRGVSVTPDSTAASMPLAQNPNLSIQPTGAQTDASRIVVPKAEPAAVPTTRDSRKIAVHQTSNPSGRAAPVLQQARTEPRPMAAPETRPTTIEGWTIREVIGSKVVLEGPTGIWTAARGDVVPGVGTVDSIVLWGNRWIVATSRGLISTQ
jgi:hypothetical protein